MPILGLSGSLRRGSYNSRLLRVAASLMPEGASLEIESIAGIPLYNADEEEANGIPSVVAALKEKIAAADGLLIATPEYNNSLPGVVKNAVDWLSRPPRDIPRVFGGLPVAIMGATPGRGGTALAQAAWLPVLRTLGTQPWFGRTIQVARAGEVFSGDDLTDEETRARLQKFIAGFAGFVAGSRRAR